MAIDLVGMGIDMQEKIARTGRRVQIGTRKQTNPNYYDLLKARVASEQMLADIASGSIGTGAKAQQQSDSAAARLLAGGALAHNNALGPADSGAVPLGAFGSLFRADANAKRSQAYQAQLAQAQSAVDQLSQSSPA